MVQRRGSASSQGSANGISRRPGELQRQNSSGSMTERTFRSPSPNRASELVQYDDDAPPVPALPPDYMYPPAIPAKSHRRAASVEHPERVSSPPPKILGGRGVSLDRGPGVMKARPVKKTGNRITSLSSIGELERTNSKESVNFSRPMSPQNSPPTSPISDRRPNASTTGLVKSPQASQQENSVGPLRNDEVDDIQNSVQQQVAHPIKKKKKSADKAAAEGSYLAAGTMGARNSGVAVDPSAQRLSTVSPMPTVSRDSPLTSDNLELSAPTTKKKKKAVPMANNFRTQELGVAAHIGYASDSDSVSERSPSTEPPRGFHTRAAGLLTKQPSTVREEREAEEQEERGIQATARNTASQKDSTIIRTASTISSRKLTDSKQHPTSTEQLSSIDREISHTSTLPSWISENSVNKGNNRPQSLSPARAAHFSSRPTIMTPDGIRHQPPPRSVSPAKSALKSSPSSRGPSPAGDISGGWSRKAPSEASDTTSLVSEDGARSMTKKKNARVSFDSEPALIGRAVSPPSTPDSPVFASPQNKDSSKKIWLGVGRDRKQGSVAASAAADNTIVARPALPSFGSVRGRKDQNDMNLKPDTTSGTGWAKETLSRMDISADQAVGAVLARDAETRNSTSAVAGIATPDGSLSRGLGRGLEDQTDDVQSPAKSKETPTAIDNDLHDVETNHTTRSNDELPTTVHHGTVPSIAVQPATPGIENSLFAQDEWLGMPGGFPVPREDSSRTDSSSLVEHHPTDLTPAAIGLAEPEPAAAAANHDPASPAVGQVAEALRGQTALKDVREESEDDNDSIYSDAAEDLSDFDGDGFGSINAIVESPAGRSPGLAITTPPDSPISAAPPGKGKESVPSSNIHNDPSQPPSSEGWDQTQAYWSGLSQSRKQQIEKAAVPSVVAKIANNQPAPKPKKKKKTASKRETEVQTSAHPPLPPWPDKKSREEVKRPLSPKVPVMKSSMRSSQHYEAEEPHMRSTMRKSQQYEGEEPHMRSTMRNPATAKPSMRPISTLPKHPSPPEPRGSLQKKHRPMSAVAMVDYNQASSPATAKHNRAVSEGFQPRALNPVAAQPTKKTGTANIRRTTSNDSDSSSSFKKARNTTSNSGRYTMKRTMRAVSVDERPRSTYDGRSKAFSVRSPSPADSTARRPFSSAGPGMRTSMRGSFDSRAKSPTRNFGFGKAPKPKKDTKIKSPGSSRFDDSSDEEGGPKTFSSRFADSSDEEDPAPLPSDLTPVRGIPRRIDEGDSTDLEDSSVETSPRLPKSPRTPKRLEGAALASGSLRHNGPGTDSPTTTDMGTGLQAKKAVEKEKEKKRRTFLSPFGSKKREEPTMRKPEPESTSPRAAHPETRKAERILGLDSPQQSPRSPKLQRRNTPKRPTTDSWPLPQSPAIATSDIRPKTSDGTTAAKSRPEIGIRRTTLEGQAALGTNGTILGKGGKKKRFGMLRKAFGLHD